MNLKILFQRHLSLIVGCIVTVLWLGGFCYADGLSWEAFESLALNEKGDFLAGLFAPLAFFWLVLGYYQQGKELRLQAKELNESVKAQTRQAESVEANTRHAARDVFLQFVSVLFDELEAHALMIAKSFPDNFDLKVENRALLFIDLSNVIKRDIWGIANSYIPMDSLFDKDHSVIKYCRTFELILAETTKVDPKLVEYYEQSSAGMLYQTIKAYYSLIPRP